MFAKHLSVALITVCSLITGCSGASDVACDRIYKECNLSLTDTNNSAVSYQSCQAQMLMPRNEKLADCFAVAPCGSMGQCIQGATTPPAAPAAPATQTGSDLSQAGNVICDVIMNQCGIQLSANGQALSIQQCSQAIINPQNRALVECLSSQQSNGCAGIKSCMQ